jgi:hypothetical protein
MEEEKLESLSFHWHEVKDEQLYVNPFKIDVRLDVPLYVGSLDVEKLENWLRQLEINFGCNGLYDGQSIYFARLKMSGHALSWWEAYC